VIVETDISRPASSLPSGLLSLLLFILLLAPRSGGGVQGVELLLGKLSGAGWKAEDVVLRIDWAGDARAVYSLAASRVEHSLLSGPLLSPRIDCSEGRLTGGELSCSKGEMTVGKGILDKEKFPVAFLWDPGKALMRFDFDQVAIGNGRLALDFQIEGDLWSAAIRGKGVDLRQLQDTLVVMGVSLPDFILEGGVNLTLNIAGRQRLPTRGDWDLRFDRVLFSDSSGELLGEELQGRWQGAFDRSREEAYSGNMSLELDAGAILTPYAFLAPDGEKIAVSTDFGLTAQLDQLRFSRLHYRHGEVLEFTSRGELVLGASPGISGLAVSIQHAGLSDLVENYLKPVFSSPMIEQMRVSGNLSGELLLAPEPQVALNLKDVGVEQSDSDGSGRKVFGFEGLDGVLHWRENGPAAASLISWQSGHLFEGIEIGPSALSLQASGQGMTLSGPTGIPVLDGSLQAERFELEQLDSGLRLAFQGYLTPISMNLVSRALGWPELSGVLSGMVPRVSYEEGALQFDGTMLIRVFDGRILIKALRLEDLLGALPVLQAEIELRELDLETLTKTFSFGKITGRLEGRVDDLRLENWRPVSFDARFNTPGEDRSRHRISQRAVDNISDLGGSGVSGAISRSFLKMFKEFGYSRLGISCTLKQGVCEMGGVEPAKQGYYLVKGGGVPRIDIVGFNRRTDWGILVDKLVDISEGGTPVVQ